MATGSVRPLMDAFRVAQTELILWLVEDYGFDKWEAFQVVSQVGSTRVGNAVHPNYTVVAKFPNSESGCSSSGSSGRASIRAR